jgi:arylsulfatase A-like enzyme
VPPKGAPNVLLIITDDSGYGVPGTFGGVRISQEESAEPA